MLELIALIAAASNPGATAVSEPRTPVTAETSAPDMSPPIDVRGSRVLCRAVYDSAQTRMNRQRVCRTQLEWDEIRDQAAEFYNDLPRRNPRQSRDLARNE